MNKRDEAALLYFPVYLRECGDGRDENFIKRECFKTGWDAREAQVQDVLERVQKETQHGPLLTDGCIQQIRDLKPADNFPGADLLWELTASEVDSENTKVCKWCTFCERSHEENSDYFPECKFIEIPPEGCKEVK
jgi:hypothetical protein